MLTRHVTATPELPAPPELPPILTMADDLAQALGREPPAAAVTGPAPSLPPARAGAPPGKTVALPPPAPPVPARRRGVRVMLAGGLLLALVVVIVLLVAFLPRRTGTVADIVPKEALGFASLVPRADEPLLPILLSSFPGLSPEALADATDVTYLVLPGGSPAAAVPALLVRGLPTIDLSGAPDLAVVTSGDARLVVASSEQGRLRGLTGKRWGGERRLRGVFRGLPSAPRLLVGLRSQLAGNLLAPSFPHAVPAPDLALAASGAGADPALVVRSAGGAGGTRGAPAGLAGRVPASAVAVIARADLLGDLTRAATAAGRLPESLRTVLAELNRQGDVMDGLRAALAGPWVGAVLPTAVPGVRDTVLLLPLTAESDVQPLLRQLESLTLKLGVYLTGNPFPEAVFQELEREGVRIRYANFGTSARAFDYAVADRVLVLATSKESMFASLDALAGRGARLGDVPDLQTLQLAERPTPFVLLRASPETRAALPPALAVFGDLLPTLVLTGDSRGPWEGRGLIGAPPSTPAPVPVPSPTALPTSSPLASPAT